MAVQIGQDNVVYIKKDILNKICLSLKQYNYETGGIIGVNEEGVISAFQFDKTYSSNPFEYHPNVDFLNRVINVEWANEDIEFIGFVHSHLNNCEISQQDIEYAREIIKENIFMHNFLLGVFKLCGNIKEYKWHLINNNSIDIVVVQEDK